MICFLRCSPVNEDIRLRKYISALESTNVDYVALTWDRLGKKSCAKNEFQFTRYSAYGLKWKNAFNKLAWQFFLITKLYTNRRHYNVIHSVDFDTIFPALLFKFFLRKKVVFDIYDAFSVGFTNRLLQRPLAYVETRSCYVADCLILPDEQRLEQLQLNKNRLKSFLEVENVPHFKSSEDILETASVDSRICLSYVGVFDLGRGLEDIMDFVRENDEFVLNIAGTGTLNDLVTSVSLECDRIKYHGQVEYEKGLSIMKNSDVILGMYYKDRSNHIYAAPNKFFEALFLGKPILTTRGTLVGTKVSTHDTGYVIDEGLQNISQCLLHIATNSRSYEDKCKNATALWIATYSNYFNDRLEHRYVNLMTKLNDN